MTLWVFQEVLEGFARVQAHHSLHVLLGAFAVIRELVLQLVFANLRPVFPFHDPLANLWHSLNDECILSCYIARVLHHVHLFESTKHWTQHGQLIKQYLIHVLAQTKQVLLTEGCHLVFATRVSRHKEIVYRQPDLSFDLRELSSLVRFDFLPLLVFKLLIFALGILPEPRFEF